MSSQLQQARKERDEALAEVERLELKIAHIQMSLRVVQEHLRGMIGAIEMGATACAALDLRAPIPPIDATTDEPPGAPAAARPDVSIHRGPLSWRLGDPEPRPKEP